ncbi:MAG TPA: substrate-binding domain-containing protein [Roseiarcus sp.]|nr:substrate-binding domain-containing protein [Roseiarcus sp.]
MVGEFSKQVTRRGALARGLALGGGAALGGMLGPMARLDRARAAGEELKIFMVPKWTTLTYFQVCADGGKKAAKELGASFTYTGPASPNAEQQVASLQSVLAQGPDAIVLSAIEPNNVAPVLERAMKQGVTVVTYDADCAAQARDLFCNQLTYELAARTYLDCALLDNPAGGKAIFMAATPTTVNHMQQIAAMKRLMATEDKYKVFTPGDTYFVEDDFSKSEKTMRDVMDSDPSVKVALSGSAVSAPAAAQAIVTAHKEGQVWATGAALPSSIKKYLDDGSEKAFALWDPANLGYMATCAAHLIHTGKLKAAPGATFEAGSLGTFTVSEGGVSYYNRPLIFTKDNVAQYPW